MCAFFLIDSPPLPPLLPSYPFGRGTGPMQVKLKRLTHRTKVLRASSMVADELENEGFIDKTRDLK